MSRRDNSVWDLMAVRSVVVGMPMILAILGFILVKGLTWAIWVTNSLQELHVDIKAIKIANHIAVGEPVLGQRKRSIYSIMGLPIEPLLEKVRKP